jgi:hypothetical protein
VCSSTCSALFRKHVFPTFSNPDPTFNCLCHPTDGLMGSNPDGTALTDVCSVDTGDGASEVGEEGGRGGSPLRSTAT